MKWINGYTRQEKLKRSEEKKRKKRQKKENWHRWFAWFPITVGVTIENRKIKMWLCYVERKGTYYWEDYLLGDFWNYSYQEIKK